MLRLRQVEQDIDYRYRLGLGVINMNLGCQDISGDDMIKVGSLGYRVQIQLGVGMILMRLGSQEVRILVQMI